MSTIGPRTPCTGIEAYVLHYPAPEDKEEKPVENHVQNTNMPSNQDMDATLMGQSHSGK